MQLLHAQELPIYKADGSNYEKMNALLDTVEYCVLFTRGGDAVEENGEMQGEQGDTPPLGKEGGDDGHDVGSVVVEDARDGVTLQQAIEAVRAHPVYTKEVGV